jgi:hypothetical protein
LPVNLFDDNFLHHQSLLSGLAALKYVQCSKFLIW